MIADSYVNNGVFIFVTRFCILNKRKHFTSVRQKCIKFGLVVLLTYDAQHLFHRNINTRIAISDNNDEYNA